MPKVLVTGASGFIGLHLCRALLQQGAEVHAVCRSAPAISNRRLQWHKVDLRDSDAARRIFASIRAEFIVHLSSLAQGERELALVLPTFRGELETTVNVLTSAAETRCRRLVMAGSLEEPDPGEIPSSPYAAAKAASRSYARMFHKLYGLPTVMTRIYMTYGPGQSPKKLIPHSIARILRGDVLRIASPTRKVDWIYVEDVVCGLLAVLNAPGLEGESVDLGSGELVAIRDLIIRIRNLTNLNAPVEFGGFPERPFEQVRMANTTKTHMLIGWRPTVPLDEGLARTVDFYTNSGTHEAAQAAPL